MTLDADMLGQLLEVFRAELGEHLGVFDRTLMSLERGTDANEGARLLEEMMRNAHSLKGAARAISCPEIEQLAHRMEGVMSDVPERSIPSAEGIAQLYRVTDLIRQAWQAREEGSAEGFDLEDALRGLDAPAADEEPDGKGEAAESESRRTRMVPCEPVPQTDDRRGGDKRRRGLEDRRRRDRRLEDAVATRETIRVDVAKLDGLMAQVQELMVMRIRGEQRQDELRLVRTNLLDLERDHREVANSVARLARNGADPELTSLHELLVNLRERSVELRRQIDGFMDELASDGMRTTLITGDLQEGVRKARMLPVGTLFESFRRMVRDLAKTNEKDVDFVTRGADIELDKQILEALKDPLIHLLRNALDHGLETPEARRRVGKSPTGTIELSAAQRGNNVVVEISDDGAGIDCEALRAKAVDRKLITPDEARQMSDAEVVLFIFQTGFSTSAIVTDISGRGVGLDVVRENVGRLGGVVDVQSTPGARTTFRMTLPLTVSTFRGLIIETRMQRFALPLSSVIRAARVESGEIREVGGRRAIVFDDVPVPVVDLGDVLELSGPDRQPADDGRVSVVVLGMAERRVAFVTDMVVKEEEIIVKSLGPQLARVRNVAAATIMGDGSVVLILNVPDLIRTVHSRHPETMLMEQRRRERSNRKCRLLVVDDSVTTRTLEKNILRTAGYDVTVASDAEEAWERLSEGDFDLVITDVRMPGEDGFSLTRRIRCRERTRNLPVIVLTSLESDADRARGIEVGADAYIVKRGFDQQMLLKTVQQLV